MKIKTLTAGIGVLATALLVGGTATAQGRWELLGTRSVGFQVDRDVIGARGQGRFQVIRICVGGNAVQIRDLDVRFANGERQDLQVNAFLRPGQCSANLDLQGRARRIDRIRLVYNAIPNFRGRAVVSVYGLQAAMGPGPRPGPGPGPGPGIGSWDRLGTRMVGFQADRDTFDLAGEGRFRALRLCVARNVVQFRDVEVFFGNGERQDLPVQRRVRPGECTAPLDLEGRTRRIRRVVMLYNSAPNFRGQAAVTLYGLR